MKFVFYYRFFAENVIQCRKRIDWLKFGQVKYVDNNQKGDDKKLREKKFEAMYNEYGEYAYIIAYNILKSKHAAEDAVQDAFGKVWNNLNSFDKDNAKKKIGAYTRNAAIDIYRKNKTENTTLDEWEQSAIDFETPGDIVASRENVEKYIRK